MKFERFHRPSFQVDHAAFAQPLSKDGLAAKPFDSHMARLTSSVRLLFAMLYLCYLAMIESSKITWFCCLEPRGQAQLAVFETLFPNTRARWFAKERAETEARELSV